MEPCGTGVVNGFHHGEVITDIVDIPRCILRRPDIEVSEACRSVIAIRIPILTSSTNVEVAGMLDGVGERDLLARILVEQMVGRIKRGFHGFPCFQIPFQSTGESIFTAKLIVSGTAFSCNAGGLRDDDDSRFYYVIFCCLIISFSETYHVSFLLQFLLAFG